MTQDISLLHWAVVVLLPLLRIELSIGIFPMLWLPGLFRDIRTFK